jgi:hypothetical protein
MSSRSDVLSGVFWLVIGLVIAGWSATFPFGRLAEPGPALLPVLCGAVLAVLGAIVVVSGLRQPTGAAASEAPGGTEARRILWTVVGVAAAALVLEHAGFTATVFGLVAFLLLVVAGRSWALVVTYAALTAAACVLIFRFVLGVELPRGWLGF